VIRATAFQVIELVVQLGEMFSDGGAVRLAKHVRAAHFSPVSKNSKRHADAHERLIQGIDPRLQQLARKARAELRERRRREFKDQDKQP